MIINRPAESCHWYDQLGNPAYTIVGKNGKERNTTLSDARKEQFVPSVTTLMKVVANYGIQRYRENQLVLSALTMDRGDETDLMKIAERIIIDAGEHAKQASERGTRIHALVESGFVDGTDNLYYRAVRAALDAAYPNRNWVAEASFCHQQLGYGGKIDLHCEDIVADIKTKEMTAETDVNKLVYDEHGMQLSAYRVGLRHPSMKRVNIFVSVDENPVVKLYEWPEDDNNRHWEMFNHARMLWQLKNKYVPQPIKLELVNNGE